MLAGLAVLVIAGAILTGRTSTLNEKKTAPVATEKPTPSAQKLAFAVSSVDGLSGDQKIYILKENGTRELVSDKKECEESDSPNILSFKVTDNSLIFSCIISGSTYSLNLASQTKELIVSKAIENLKKSSTGEIYFDSIDQDILYKADTNGAQVIVDTIDDKYFVGDFRLSRDGDKILIEANTGMGADEVNYYVYIFDVATSQIKKLTEGRYPTWLPNGEIAFFNDSAFWKIKIDGSGKVKLVDAGADYIHDVHVGGNTMVFLKSGDVESLSTFNLTSFEVKKVSLQMEPLQNAFPMIHDISADGQKIAFRFFSTKGPDTSPPYSGIFVAELSSGKVEEITQPGEFGLFAKWAE